MTIERVLDRSSGVPAALFGDVNRINEKRQLRCKDTESKSLLKREVESESDTDGAFFQVDEN